MFKLPSVRPLVHENLNTIHNHACTMVKYELWGNNVDIVSTASMDQIFVKELIIVLLFDSYPIYNINSIATTTVGSSQGCLSQQRTTKGTGRGLEQSRTWFLRRYSRRKEDLLPKEFAGGRSQRNHCLAAWHPRAVG